MKSIWLNDVNISKRNALNTDLSTEIAVIGSGMAGILISAKQWPQSCTA